MGAQHAVRAFAPGRVNLIGEHTDYNLGLALPFALREGITVTASALSRPIVQAFALDLGENDSFALPRIGRGAGWRAFVRGAVAELQATGLEVGGTRLEITGDLDRGIGLSSSAALSVALCLALIGRHGATPPNPLELAKLCQRIENEWVGAQTGLLDQIASLFGEIDHALLVDFQALDVTSVPMQLDGHRLVLLSSGERHDNSAAEYNRRRQECLQAARRMGVESLRDALIQDLHLLPDVLARRAKHVISETGRVQQAAAALEDHDFELLGRLLDASHRSLRADFEVSTAAVEAAVAELMQAGALGARMIGGGFGGNVLGLMPPGAQAPAGATVVCAGAGARLIE